MQAPAIILMTGSILANNVFGRNHRSFQDIVNGIVREAAEDCTDDRCTLALQLGCCAHQEVQQ